MIYSAREDSYLLEKEIKKQAKGKTVLDMGTGSGIQAKAALESGAKLIIAADINKDAIKQLKQFKKENKIKNLKIIQSNLFSKIKGKFDIIAFNPPYLPEEKREPKDSRLATTGGKCGDETILRFLKQAKSHLSKEGIILLVLSSLTPKERIIKLLSRQNLSYQIISSKKLFFETLEVWEIKS